MDTPRRLRIGGLGTRIVGLVALSGLLIGSLVGLLAAKNGRDALRDQIFIDQQVSADLAAALASRYVEPVERRLNQVAGLPGLATALEAGSASQLQWITKSPGRLGN